MLLALFPLRSPPDGSFSIGLEDGTMIDGETVGERRRRAAAQRRMNRSLGAVGLGLLAAGSTLVIAVAALPDSPPASNYNVGPTSRCLRAHGYRVSGPSQGDFGRRTVEITRGHHDFWIVSFTASAAQAQHNASKDPYGVPTRRNVVFNIESVGLQAKDKPIVDCLRS
jgi:hypothetical protein